MAQIFFKNYTSAWAWVGYGHSSNLKKTDELVRKETDPHKIIVSRSHSGTVETVAKEAFDNNVKVTPAGGAGKGVKRIRMDMKVYSFKKCYKDIIYVCKTFFAFVLVRGEMYEVTVTIMITV